MADRKTSENDSSVEEFIETVELQQRKKDSIKLLAIMEEVTGLEAKMWGTSIIGFGKYFYKYDSGREADMFRVGFSPRKQSLTIYIQPGPHRYQDLLEELGKFTSSKACLYVKKLADVNEDILRTLIRVSFEAILDEYPNLNK